MQSKELGDKCFWILLDVVIIVLQYLSQKFVLSIMNCLQRVLAVSSIIEEGATFSLAR